MKTHLFIYFKVLIFLCICTPVLSQSQDFTVFVNTTDDVNDGRCDTRHCSYREALNLANGFQGEMSIFFSIGNGGDQRIEIQSDLPSITNFAPLTIDGSTQPGGSITIDGNRFTDYGLDLFSASNTVVQGILFDDFQFAGVYIRSSSSGCVIGTTESGNGFTNNRYGVIVEGTQAQIISNGFQDNDINGVFVTGNGSATIGQAGNNDANNFFIGHRFAGVEANTNVDYVNIFGNFFFCSENEGITNFNSANNGVSPPTITEASLTGVSGTASSSAFIQVYVHDPQQEICQGSNPCQGNIFLGSTTSDQFGNWELTSNDFNGPLNERFQLTATQTILGTNDNFSNLFFKYTSEFSSCFALCDTYTLSLSSDGPKCPGDEFTITANATSSSNNPEPLTFTWTTPDGSTFIGNPIVATEPGLYSVVASNSCNNIVDRILIEPEETPPATIEASYNGPICEFDTLQLFATTEKVIYEWSGPFSFTSNDQNPIVNNAASSLRSGLYFLNTLTPNNGCQGPRDTVEVLVKRPPAVQDTFLYACVNDINSSATYDLTVANLYIGFGDSTLNIRWFEDENLRIPIGVPERYQTFPRDVFAIAFDSLGCQSETAKVTLLFSPALSVSLDANSLPTCNDTLGGSIQAIITGGTAPFTYAWSDTSLQGANPSNLPGGLYELTVTDTNSCTGTAEIDLTVPANFQIRCSVLENVSRVGGNDGLATIIYPRTFTGPATIILEGPINDTLRGNNTFLDSIPNLMAGNYNVTVVDTGGCTGTCAFTITEPDCANFFVRADTRNLVCSDANEGAISFEVSGVDPITFDWDRDELDGLSIATNLAAGTYITTITDNLGCSDTITNTIIAPDALILDCGISSPITQINGTDGQASIEIKGGTPRFQLSWSGPSSGNQIVNGNQVILIDNLSAGTYTFLVVDGNGCQERCQLTFVDIDCSNLQLSLTPQDVTCFNANDAQITSMVTGANGTVTYRWNTGDTTSTLTNLPPGGYSLTIEDTTGCTLTERVIIDSPSELIIDCSATTPISRVGATDGQVNIQVDGGTAPYMLGILALNDTSFTLLTDGDITLSQLPAGTYEIILEDANNCREVCTFEIDGIDCSNFSARADTRNLSCNDANDGAIAFQTFGVAPIVYDWNQDALDGLAAATNLAAGIYITTVTDNFGCSDTITNTLTEPEALVLNCSISNPITQQNGSDGQASIEIVGGNDPFQLSWSGASTGNQTIASNQIVVIDNLSAGTYTFSVSDENGCDEDCELTFVDVDCSNLQLSLRPQDVTCFDANDGQITSIVSGAIGAVSYQWSTGASTSDLNNLPPGDYSLMIEDAAGCTFTESISINSPEAIVLDCSTTRPISRVGASDGQATIEVDGGTAPYTIIIPELNDTNITLLNAGSITLSQLAVGSYEVEFRDANNCGTSCNFEINDVDCSSLDLVADVRPVSCPGENNGVISLSPQGGSAPYSFDWANDAFDGQSTISNLSAGNYDVVISDAIGCSINRTLEVGTQNMVPTIDIGAAPSICADACANIDLNFTGQAPFNLSYRIIAGGFSTDLNFQSTDDQSSLEICASDFPANTGTIEVQFLQLTDATCGAILSQNRLINISAPARRQLDTILCIGQQIIINDQVYDEQRAFGQEIITNGAQNGCDSIIDINLFYITPPEVVDLTTNCNLNNNTFQLQFDLLGLAPYTIDGINGNLFGNTFISEALPAAGLYSISIQDGFSCSTNIEVESPNCQREGNCSISAGTLLPSQASICQFDSLIVQSAGDSQLDSNTVVRFVIHDGTVDQLGNILLSDSIGRFVFQSPLQLGTTYQTAMLVGRDNGFGVLDLSDPCLDIAFGSPVQFESAPRRPLFIQGQDTLCIGETLILSTEQYPDANLSYNWITPLGDTIRTDSNSIQFPEIGSEDAGEYAVFVSNGSCRSPIFTPHQFTTLDFPILYAGEDQVVCGLNQVQLQADPISFGTGEWSNTTGATILEPNQDQSLARTLVPGVNPFIWTVSSEDCISTDTVLVTYLPTAIARDDQLALEPGLTRITFDPFVNDEVAGLVLDNTTVQITSQPELGEVVFLEDDVVFEYTAALGNLEAIAFEYVICSPDCQNTCDTAIVMISLPDVLLEVPDGIIVGRANDGLLINNLEAFPDNEMIITNRWGVVVHRQRNYSNNDPWKGTHNGGDLPQGTYYMYLKIDGRRDAVKKTLHLIVR
ncbi:MAG: gliding motility-associated C-terminal domain-containing protein [Bacteroidota bacterium]